MPLGDRMWGKATEPNMMSRAINLWLIGDNPSTKLEPASHTVASISIDDRNSCISQELTHEDQCTAGRHQACRLGGKAFDEVLDTIYSQRKKSARQPSAN